MLQNQKGFTLIEIIAVLVILGILAAVAVPKYVALQAEAKKKAAQAQVAEVKSTLNLGYAKYFMKNGSAPGTITLVNDEAGLAAVTTDNTVGTAPDIWVFTVSAAGVIAVKSRDGDTEYAATGQWNLPI